MKTRIAYGSKKGTVPPQMQKGKADRARARLVSRVGSRVYSTFIPQRTWPSFSLFRVFGVFRILSYRALPIIVRACTMSKNDHSEILTNFIHDEKLCYRVLNVLGRISVASSGHWYFHSSVINAPPSTNAPVRYRDFYPSSAPNPNASAPNRGGHVYRVIGISAFFGGRDPTSGPHFGRSCVPPCQEFHGTLLTVLLHCVVLFQLVNCVVLLHLGGPLGAPFPDAGMPNLGPNVWLPRFQPPAYKGHLMKNWSGGLERQL